MTTILIQMKLAKLRREHNGHINKLGAMGDAPDTCQWLFGEPRDRNFCCEPVITGKPYCPRHCAKAYIPDSATPIELPKQGF